MEERDPGDEIFVQYPHLTSRLFIPAPNLLAELPEKPVVRGESLVNCRESYVYTREPVLQSREPALQSREAVLQSSESVLQSSESALQSREPPLQCREPPLQPGEAHAAAARRMVQEWQHGPLEPA